MAKKSTSKTRSPPAVDRATHCSPALLAACAKLVKARQDSPRFIGRRSLEKKCGEVIECIDDDSDPVVVERINLPNYKGEEAASERADTLSDQWTAARIIALVSQANAQDQTRARET